MIIIKNSRQPIFLIIVIISIIVVYMTSSDHYIIKSFFRLVPMVIFLYYATLQMPTKKRPVHFLVLIGFVFSIAGDAVYYWPILEFILAPAAILDGYIFYSIAFLTQIRFSLIRFLSIIPIGLFGYIVIYVLFKELDQSGSGFLIFFIFIYAFFAVMMCWTAFLTGNKWAISSSLLFIISDIIRSLNQFIFQENYFDLLIILTYFGAQLLIAHSLGTFSTKDKKAYLK